MSTKSRSICVLCGANNSDSPVLSGPNGFACFSCLGEAFSAIAKSYGKPRGPEDAKSGLTANNRCLFCDQRAPAGKLVAYRSPHCFCGECLQKAFEITLDGGPEPLAVVNF